MAEPRHKQRRTARRSNETSTSQPEPLQRKVGNRTVSGMIDQLRAADDGSGDAGGPRPWEHPTFERQADDIAARAKGMAGTKDRRGSLSGAPLADRDAAKLAFLTGKDVSKVRLHTDGASASTAASMGAHAFTSGTDIHFGKSEYDPSSSKGFELLAHEVTHAVEHPSGHDHAGNELVHAKLKGTRKAMEQLGGKKSKSLRKKALRSNWNDLLSKLGDYEKLEEQYLKATKNGTREQLDALKARLLESLAKLEAVALKWRAANDEEGSEQVTSTWDKKGKYEYAEEDERAKAPRRQAIALFLTRVRTEQVELGRGGTTSGFDEGQLAWGKDDAVGGGMNRLDQVAYTTDDGEIFEGYFKEDKGFTGQMVGHDKESGITQHDSNWGGRSVAMYRLDKLLEGGVIARTEFAVHTSRGQKSKYPKKGESNLTESTTKMGFVTEKAKGDTMGDLMDDGQLLVSGRGDGKVGLDDPTLQRCLNKLQILDAIAGQLDRHTGNYFVQRDPETGKVLGVTGIDNDMAFGGRMQSPDDIEGAHNYLALPELVDEEFGRKILRVTEQDIREILEGLLTKQEIDATVARFMIVQDAVRNLEEQDQLTSDWGKDTREEQFEKSPKLKGGDGREHSMIARELSYAIRDLTDSRTSPVHKRLREFGMDHEDAKLLVATLVQMVQDGKIDLDEVEPLAEKTLRDIDTYVDRRGEEKLPVLGKDWIELYVHGAYKGI